MAGPIWLLTDARTDVHASPGHPERPSRREAVATGVRDAAGSLLDEREVGPVEDEDLVAIHDPRYVRALDEAEAAGGGWLDADTYLVAGSMEAARLAAGATVQAALGAAGGGAEVAFAVVRPPGHHAARERGSGFCLLNNVAVGVAALRRRGLAQRVAIVDWDVHHGDGTQQIFDADADLCYASTHQYPFYPGTGSQADGGIGAAVGTMHNRPLAAGDGDGAFVAAWRDDLLPAVEAFEPEAILVSAGYDAHRADPLAMLDVTEAAFGEVSRMIGRISRRLGHPGVALTLEGGYDLGALAASAAATVTGIVAGRADGPERA